MKYFRYAVKYHVTHIDLYRLLILFDCSLYTLMHTASQVQFLLPCLLSFLPPISPMSPLSLIPVLFLLRKVQASRGYQQIMAYQVMLVGFYDTRYRHLGRGKLS